MNAHFVSLLIVPLAFVGMWVAESRWPARAYVPVRGWRLRGVVFFVLCAVVGSATPVLWARTGLTMTHIFNLAPIGWWGVPLGIAATTFIDYWWHRSAHRVNAIWLLTHQLHHSAQRVDIPGAFYTHPLEVVMKSTLGLIVTNVVLGLGAPTAALVSSLIALLSIFQHWNVRTPRWLGWLLPRPEMHALHHERGVHARNYGDLPVWDWLFGTFENPEVFAGEVGFEAVPSARVLDMLVFRNVSS